MTGPKYKATIERLGLTQKAAGELFGVKLRLAQRWCVDGPSPAAALALRLAIKFGVTVDEMLKLRDKRD